MVETQGPGEPGDVTLLLAPAPAGAVSALCSIDLITASGQSFEAALDRARLEAPGEIFTDGFESGDVSAWSSSASPIP